MYKTYCDEAKVSYPMSQRVFKEELKNYFREYRDRWQQEDGARVRSRYTGFRTDIFEESEPEPPPTSAKSWLQLEVSPFWTSFARTARPSTPASGKRPRRSGRT